MSMTENLVSALKRCMKSRGITYKDAAKALELSEVSIKRLFSEKSFSLSRIETLCDLANTDFAELLEIAESAIQKKQSLTIQQEQAIVDNPKLLLVGVCIINRFSFEDIIEKYQFKEPELIGYFTQFDKLDIIELLPGNRYRLKILANFHWLSNGPIQGFFIDSLLREFFFEGKPKVDNPINYLWGMLTQESAEEMSMKIKRLMNDYVQLAANETKLPYKDKKTSSLLVVFKKDWEPAVFQEHWRKE